MAARDWSHALDSIAGFISSGSSLAHAEEMSAVLALQDALIRLPDEIVLSEIDKLASLLSGIPSLSSALDSVSEVIESAAAASAGNGGAPIEQMYAYIESKYADPDFSLKQMAQRYSMSVAQLSGYFKRETATTLNDYISSLKMEKAKQLLTRSSMSVNDIGMSVGYVNCNSFVRRFKQLVGMTPGEYRKFYYASSDIEKL